MNAEHIRLKSRQAFTLIELIVVVVILGVIAALAVPNYMTSAERVKTSEGLSILKAVYDADQRYYTENNVYAALMSGLDLSIPASQNFNPPAVHFIAALGDPIVDIKRNGSGGWNYTLQMDPTGVISCVDSTPGQCAKVKIW